MLDALRFLTVLPIGGDGKAPTAGALVGFPVVGVLVGLSWAAPVALLSRTPVPTAVIAAVVLIVDAIVTGGLQLDATADVGDAVASRRRGDEAVAVMRDPAVGALGAATLMLALLLRFSLLVLLTGLPAWGGIIAAPVIGRTAMALLVATTPSRRDGSLADAFTDATWRVLAVGLPLGAVAVWVFAGLGGVTALAVCLIATVAYRRWWRGRFGGLTGDGVGTCGLAIETLALTALAAALI